MKKHSFLLVLTAALGAVVMTGCQAKQSVNSAAAAVQQGVSGALQNATTPTLSREEAQSIALEHAGLTADQVTALHTEYELERGIAQYDVEFHNGNWEYDYEIHANTGEILSFTKDD